MREATESNIRSFCRSNKPSSLSILDITPGRVRQTMAYRYTDARADTYHTLVYIHADSRTQTHTVNYEDRLTGTDQTKRFIYTYRQRHETDRQKDKEVS